MDGDSPALGAAARWAEDQSEDLRKLVDAAQSRITSQQVGPGTAFLDCLQALAMQRPYSFFTRLFFNAAGAAGTREHRGVAAAGAAGRTGGPHGGAGVVARSGRRRSGGRGQRRQRGGAE